MPYAFDRRSVSKLIQEFIAAWNETDLRRFAALLEEDVLVVDGQTRVKGRAKAARALVALARSGELQLSSIEYHAFHPDIVLCEISWPKDASTQNILFLAAVCGYERWELQWARVLLPAIPT